MAERAVLARRLCLRYRIFFYIALVLVVLQVILMLSFYSSSQSPALKSQLARWDLARNALAKFDGQQPAEDVRPGRPAKRTGLSHNQEELVGSEKEPVKQDRFKCNITSKDALSAIARAKTLQCRQTITDTVCLQQAQKLYPTKLPRFCPLKGNNTGLYVGCFKDDKLARIFPGVATNLQQTNTPMKCVNMCLMTGFHLAGLQFSYECWCGQSYGEALRLSEQACGSPCPADPSQTCGGFNAMKIYHTGLGGTPAPPPSPTTMKEGKTDKVRIVFVLTVNGRAVRQIRRLLKAIYHRDHYYYIHIDARQEYLYRELTSLGEKFDNIHLAVHRFASIWGGASLLSMLLQCMRDLLSMKRWKWDFFLNLSESDFPVKPLEDLVTYLTHHRDKNFVKSHGTGTLRFVRKQGLVKLFVECDTHMWRVGERQLPDGIRVDGGSDWVSLNRVFCRYLVSSNDELLTGLKQYWKYSLLPAESFFHTVLHNSAYCTTIVNNNLHLTNWRRHQGCKCQYKHIVDWCGCSPNDFMPQDMKKIMLTRNKPIFFARKFEAIVNQEVINEVEKYISGDNDRYIAGMNSYWQNEYHHEDEQTTCDDAYLTLYNAFIRHTIKTLAQSGSCHLVAGKLLQVHIYSHLDSFQGLLINFEVTSSGQKTSYAVEAFLQPRSSYRILKPAGLIKRLKHIEVGTKFDPKEEIFRNFGSLIGPHSDVILRHSWGAGTKGIMTVVYVDPAHVIAASYDVTVPENEHIGQQNPKLNKPLRPGLWNVKLLYSSDVVAETDFLVTPLSHSSGRPITAADARAVHRGPAGLYTDNDFHDRREALHLINTKLAMRTARLNEVKTGASLLAWIDSLASKTWSIVDTCYYGDSPLSSCAEIAQCKATYWSSQYTDLKSEISGVDVSTGKLLR